MTELEVLLLEEAYRRYRQFGFPSPEAIVVVRRVFDDCGRYTYLSHPGLIDIADGMIPLAQVDLGGGKFLIVANLHVVDRSIEFIELMVAGELVWNGDEPNPMVLLTE